MKSPSILIIGDVCLDEFLHGECYGVAPEAPIPVLKVKKVEHRLGMAANVAKQLTSLGANVLLIGAGNPKNSTFHLLCQQYNIKQELINDRQLTIKQRGLTDSVYISRNDYEDMHPVEFRNIKKILDHTLIKNTFDAIILSDYGKGVIGQPKEIISYLRNKTNAKIFVDPDKFKTINDYSGVYCIKANEKESLAITGKKYTGNACDEMGKYCNLPIVTMGAFGVLYDRQGYTVKGIPTTVQDVIGCGDVFISKLVYDLSNGLKVRNAIINANRMAAKNAEKFGT